MCMHVSVEASQRTTLGVSAQETSISFSFFEIIFFSFDSNWPSMLGMAVQEVEVIHLFLPPQGWDGKYVQRHPILFVLCRYLRCNSNLHDCLLTEVSVPNLPFKK